MPEDRADFLASFTYGVEFGLLYVRDAEGEGLPAAPDWDPSTSPVLVAPEALLVAVRHYVDGPLHCELWDSGERSERLPHVLHTGALQVPSGVLLVGDVNEDIVLRTRPDGDTVGITVRADSRLHAAHVQIELSGV